MRNRRVKNMNTNKRETALKAISNLKIKLQEAKTKNEANTIQNFIIKILSEFGWDVFDDAEVDMQYTQNISGAADIALKNSNNPKEIYAFIEAKKLGDNNLNKHIAQGFRYCYGKGVNMLIITNGRKWNFYAPLQHGYNEEERLLISVDLLEDTEEKIIEIFSKLLSKESYKSGEIVENMKQYFSKAPEIQKKVATDSVIMEAMQSEEFIKNIMEKIRSEAKISVEKEYIIEKLGLIKKGYEQYLETEVEKNKNKYEDKNRKKRKDYRDKLVANIVKKIETSAPDEDTRIRDGEIKIVSGSEDVEFAIRVNVMHKDKRISFQVIIKYSAEELYKKMKEITEEIKAKTNIEFIEKNTNNVRTDRKNHVFNFEYSLVRNESLKSLDTDVVKFMETIKLTRNKVIDYFMQLYKVRIGTLRIKIRVPI